MTALRYILAAWRLVKRLSSRPAQTRSLCGILSSAFNTAPAICLIASFVCGCLNCYTRFPTSPARIESCYQCTREAAMLSVIAAFPQMMSDSPGEFPIRWMNMISIPFLGLPIAVDAVLEGVVDTVCLPADWMISEARAVDKIALAQVLASFKNLEYDDGYGVDIDTVVSALVQLANLT